MINGGEAADQIVRMSLETGEVALKISGQGAKQLAVMLYAILKEQKKTRGRVRMESLIRSGKPLTVFSVKESDLKAFVQEAKRYGIMYCAVRNPRGSSDGMIDVMVKEEDAGRINRIVERFKFASVKETASVKAEIEKGRAEKGKGITEKEKSALGQKPVDRDVQLKDETDKLIDALFEKPLQKGEEKKENPPLVRMENPSLSEPTLEKQRNTGGTSKQPKDRTSVKAELKEIRAAREFRQEKRVERDRGNSKNNSILKKPKKKAKTKER